MGRYSPWGCGVDDTAVTWACVMPVRAITGSAAICSTASMARGARMVRCQRGARRVAGPGHPHMKACRFKAFEPPVLMPRWQGNRI